ncbi:MAG: hypothetical protein V7K47_25855 [Nostoc sp.]
MKSQKLELKQLKGLLEKVNEILLDLLSKSSSVNQMRSLFEQKLAEIDKVIASTKYVK